MALTLIEASKLVSGEVKRSAIIQMFAENSPLLSIIPFDDIPGGSLAYNIEGKLPGVAFRGYNEAYDESTGIVNPQVEVLRIAGGDLDVDKALIKTRGAGIRSTQEAMKVKALALYLTGKLIRGDSEADPREFDGLRKRITGRQLKVPTTANSNNGPLSIERLDEAIDDVDGATHIIMNKAMRRKLTKAAKSSTISGEITYTKDDLGRQVTMYNDLPIITPEYDDVGDEIIAFNEAGPSGGTTCTSVYVVSIGDGKIMGLQNGIMDVTDLGEIDEKPVMRTRVEWLVGLAAMHGRSAARIWGITNADITA